MTAHVPDDAHASRLAFYATPPHACSYLPGRTAVTLFADPYARLSSRIYSRLAHYGFRRSGRHIYRPACPGCDACIPVRVPVAWFRPRRSQRRAWRQNEDLAVRERTAVLREEDFALYRRYVSSRHPGGGMDHSTPEQYLEFLTSDWSETRFVEFRLDGALAMIAVLDRLEDALSAVYTFFDPDLHGRSPGTFAILWAIEQARRLGLSWLYLGYWIADCAKMSYKDQFRPLEQFRDGRWLPV